MRILLNTVIGLQVPQIIVKVFNRRVSGGLGPGLAPGQVT
jgi:hypothetical protein